LNTTCARGGNVDVTLDKGSLIRSPASSFVDEYTGKSAAKTPSAAESLRPALEPRAT